MLLITLATSVLFGLFFGRVFVKIVAVLIAVTICVMFWNDFTNSRQSDSRVNPSQVEVTLRTDSWTIKHGSAYIQITNHSEYKLDSLDFKCKGTDIDGNTVEQVLAIDMHILVEPKETRTSRIDGSILNQDSTCIINSYKVYAPHSFRSENGKQGL